MSRHRQLGKDDQLATAFRSLSHELQMQFDIVFEIVILDA
jgi:hypothetical protein